MLSALIVRPFLIELGVGLVFGFIVERPLDWGLRRLKHEDATRWRWVGATLIVTVSALLFVVPAVAAIWIALRDLVALLSDAPGELGMKLRRLLLWVQQRSAGMGFHINTVELLRRAQGLSGAAATVVARGAGKVLTATPAALFSLALMLIATASFAAEGPALRERVLRVVIPWERERAVLRRTTASVIEGVVIANLGVSVIQAAIVAVATLVLGIPNAAVWSVASFALSFVPFVGTGLVTVSAAAYLFAVGRSGAGVVMLVVAVIAGSIDNVLRPLLTQGSIELSFLWRLVAFVGGIAVFGLPGVLIGPLALSWAQSLWILAHEEDE